MLSTQELQWLSRQSVGEVRSVEQFKHGLTNDVFLVTNQVNKQFVFKRLNQQARSSNDRQAELLVQKLASQYDLTSKVLAHNSAYKLQQYIPGGLLPTDAKNMSVLLATQLHRIHQLPIPDAPKQRLFFELQQLKVQLNRNVNQSIFIKMSELAKQLDNSSRCDTLCHGDLSMNNILKGLDGQIYIIDWEYAVIACPAYDLAFCNCINAFSETESKQLIENYYLQLTLQPAYSLDSLQKECQLYLKLFQYINELWVLCFVEKS